MTAYEEYKATGMLGNYSPADILGICCEEENTVLPEFGDADVVEDSGTIEITRNMYINGTVFRVRSRLVAKGKTPTEQLLRLIEKDEK